MESSAEEMEEVFNEFGIEQPMRQLGRGAFRSALAAAYTKVAEFYSVIDKPGELPAPDLVLR